MSNLAKKLFVISLTITTIAWAMGGVFVARPALAVDEGDLIKTATSAAVYYVGADSKKYVFPDEKVYFSWYENFNSVQTVSQDTLQSYTTSANVVARAGTKLVQFVAIGAGGLIEVDDPKVYAVEPNGVRRWIETAEVAEDLYGADWEMMIYPVPNTLISNYTDGASLADATYPEGSLVKTSGSSTVYYINGDGEKQPLTDAGFTANMFQDMYVLTALDLSGYADGTSITGADATLTNVAQTGAGVTVGSGLTVAKASDNPAATSIIADTDGSQGQISLLKLNFTAASDGAVKVTTLKLKRVGINATTDIDTAYLFDADGNWLTSHQSIASDYITFSNSAGLFTVTAGTTKEITVKFDLNKSASAGKTIGFKVDASTDITTDGATVNGTFPMEGNLMTVAVVTDFGQLTAANISPSTAATMNPSTTAQDLWTFSLTGSSQDITLEKVNITNIGSTSNTDIQDLMLYVDGAQIGTTQANLGTSNAFTFSGLNYIILNGQAKNFTVKGKVIAGSSKTFTFSQQNSYDITAKDNNYNVYIVPNDGTAGQWTANSASATTVNTGTLSINLNIASPIGYMPGGLAVDTVIAEYDLTAVGEAVKVSTLNGTVVTANPTQLGMDQVKLFFDGSQVGVTQDATSTATSWSNLGSTLVVPADGTAHTLEIKGRTKEGDGTSYAAGTTFYFTLAGTATGAQGASSLTVIDLSGVSVDSNTITVSASAPTIAKNTNINDYTIDNPTGVKNAQDVVIASFTIIGGSAEPIDVTSFKIQDHSATVELGDYYQNLEVWNGNTDTKIGDTVPNLNSGTTAVDTYSFTPLTPIRVGISESLVLNVKADIKAITSALSAQTILAELDDVSYNKVNSGGSTTYSTDTDGQADVILLSGTLTVTAPDSQVPANIITMSPVGSYNTVELAKFKFVTKFEEMRLEKITFNELIVKNLVVSTTNATSSLINYTLWNGTTPIGGYGLDSVTSTPNEGKYIEFNISPGYVLPIGTNNLTLKAMTNTAYQSAAGSLHRITLDAPDVQIVYGNSSQTAITGQPTAAINGSLMQVTRSMPIVTTESWTDKTLTNGAQETLYKWKVTPSGDTSAGGVRIKKMTIETTLTDTTTTTGVLTFDDFALYKDGLALTPDNANSGDYFIYDGTGTLAADRLDTVGSATMFVGYFDGWTTANTTLNSATGTAVIVFRTEDIVPADGAIYELRARVTNVSSLSTDADSISSRVMGGDIDAMYGNTPPTPNAAYASNTWGALFLDYYPALATGGSYGGSGWGMNLNSADASAGTEYVANFIWSDYSKDSTHDSITLPATAAKYTDTSSTQDWFSGYKVKTSATGNTYLPLTTVSLSK